MPVFQIPRGIDYSRYLSITKPIDPLDTALKAISVGQGLLQIESGRQNKALLPLQMAREEALTKQTQIATETAQLSMEHQVSAEIRRINQEERIEKQEVTSTAIRKLELESLQRQKAKLNILDGETTWKIQAELQKNRMLNEARLFDEAEKGRLLEDNNVFSDFRQTVKGEDYSTIISRYNEHMNDQNIRGDNKALIETTMSEFDKRPWHFTDENGNDAVLTGAEIRTRSASAKNLQLFEEQHQVHPATLEEQTQDVIMKRLRQKYWYITDPEQKRALVMGDLQQAKELALIESNLRKLGTDALRQYREKGEEEASKMNLIGGVPWESLFTGGRIRDARIKTATILDARNRLEAITTKEQTTKGLSPTESAKLASERRVLNAFNSYMTMTESDMFSLGTLVLTPYRLAARGYAVMLGSTTKAEEGKAFDAYTSMWETKRKVNKGKLTIEQGAQRVHVIMDSMYNDDRSTAEKTQDQMEALADLHDKMSRGYEGSYEAIRSLTMSAIAEPQTVAPVATAGVPVVDATGYDQLPSEAAYRGPNDPEDKVRYKP